MIKSKHLILALLYIMLIGIFNMMPAYGFYSQNPEREVVKTYFSANNNIVSDENSFVKEDVGNYLKKEYIELSGSIIGDEVRYDGNIVIKNYCTISAKKVICSGDMVIEGEVFIHRGSKIEIGGDMRIQKCMSDGSFGKCKGVLKQYGDTIVHGNIYVETTKGINLSGYSILETEGSIYQIGKETHFLFEHNTGRILLSGENEQKISFERVDYDAKLGYIEIKDKVKPLLLATPVYGICLTHDTMISSTDKYGDVRIPGLYTGEHTVIIEGNFVSCGDCISGKYLVSGDVIAENLRVSYDANLEIKGDLRLQRRKEDGTFDETLYGLEQWGNTVVHGDMYAETRSGIYFSFEGVLELKGNLEQIGKNTRFITKDFDNHILFTGEEEQTVSFDRADPNTKLGRIVVANSFNRLNVTTPVYGMHATHNLNLTSSTGYVELHNFIDEGKNLHIEDCSLISCENNIHGSWNVDKDFLLNKSGATSLVKQSSLDIKGNMRLQQLTPNGNFTYVDTNMCLYDNSHVTVEKDCIFQAYALRIEDDSTLEIKGNLKQIGDERSYLVNEESGRIVFTGKDIQTIEAVKCKNPVNIGNVSQGSNKNRIKTVGSTIGIIAAGDLNIEGGSETYSLKLNEFTVQSNGNLIFDYLNLERGKLKCNDIVISRTLSVDKGLLLVERDLIVREKSSIRMDEEGAINIKGSLRYNSLNNSYFQKGIVKVSGDIINKGKGHLGSVESSIVYLSSKKVHKILYETDDYGNSKNMFLNVLYSETSLKNIILPPKVFTDTKKPKYPWKKFVNKNFAIPFNETLKRHFGHQGVYAPTGNFSDTYDDMNVKTVVGDIVFSRTYNSLDTNPDSGIGMGFTFSYFIRLSKNEDNISIQLPKGQIVNFKAKNEPSGLNYEALDSRNILTYRTGTYELKTLENVRYFFNDSGELDSIETQEGNRLFIDNVLGRPIKLHDISGTDITFDYDSEGHLNKIKNNLSDEIVTYTYDNNRLISVTDATGRTTSYKYDGVDNCLSQVINNADIITHRLKYIDSGEHRGKILEYKDSAGNCRIYDYGKIDGHTVITDSPNTDGKQRVEIQAYDTLRSVTGIERYEKYQNFEGNWIESEHNITSVKYVLVNGENKYNEVKSQSDVYGNTIHYTRDKLGNIIKIKYPDDTSESSEYKEIGENNCKISETNRAGISTLYFYDSLGTVVEKQVECINGGNTYNPTWDQSYYGITSYTYDDGNVKGLVKTSTNPLGGVTSYTYTPKGWIASISKNGLEISYFYDNRGLITKEILSGANIENVVMDYDYNQAGEEIRKTVHGENLDKKSVTRTVRDKIGRVIQTIEPVEYVPLADNIEADTYELSESGTRMEYDSLGNITSKIDPLGNVISYSYDIYGNTICEKYPNGSYLTTNFDSLNRITSVKKYDSKTEELSLVKDIQYKKRGMYLGIYTTLYYDKNGGIKGTTEAWQDFEGKIVRLKDADGNISTKTYSKGLLTREANALGEGTTYHYNGERIKYKISDFQGNNKTTTYYTYDVVGNVIKTGSTINKIGNPAKYNLTENEYDCWGNLLSTKLKDGEKANYKQYVYDSLNRVIREYSGLHAPLIITENSEISTGDDVYSKKIYEYDYLENITGVTDALGQKIVASYDASGNQISSVDRNGTLTSTKYDLLGRKILEQITGENSDDTINRRYEYDSNGLITKITENDNVTDYYYNGIGMLIGENSSDGIRKAYSYDNQGNMTESSIYKDNNILQFVNRTYDNMGRLQTVRDQNGYGATYTYDKVGRLVNTRYSNGITEEVTYNARGKIRTQVNKTSNGNIISEYSYTYCLDGSPATKKEKSGITKYEYDDLCRLKHVEYSDKTKDEYYFDDSGNCITKCFTDKKNHKKTVESVYDANNRLMECKEGENVTTFEYDSNGNLLSKTENDKKVSQRFDLLNRMTSWSDGNKQATYDYYTNNMRRSKTVDGKTIQHVWIGDEIATDISEKENITYLQGIKLISSNYGYYIYSGHGDVVQVTDDNGNVKSNYDYDAYGNAKLSNEGDNPYRYCGEYTDLESGYNYLRARYYDPKNGRFISEDPKNHGLNWYAYCENNPTKFIDPSGEIPVETALDIASFGVSYYQYAKEPSWSNFAYVMWDFAAMFMPYVPGSYVEKGMELGVKNGGRVLAKAGQYEKNGIWLMDKFQRGYEAERLAGGMCNNFPKIDKFVTKYTENNIKYLSDITSIKSIDITAKTYAKSSKLKSVLKRYVNKLAEVSRTPYKGEMYKVLPNAKRTLEVIVPPVELTAAQTKVFMEVSEYAKKNNIQMVTKFLE